MFIKRKYELVNNREEEIDDMEPELPPVLCSALSASLHAQQDDQEDEDGGEVEVPVLFSSLASSILAERRERQRRTRRRHHAEVQTPGRADPGSPDLLMEPLASLSISDEDSVEMRTLLEDDSTVEEDAERRTSYNNSNRTSRKRSIANLHRVSQASVISSKVIKKKSLSLLLVLSGSLSLSILFGNPKSPFFT